MECALVLARVSCRSSSARALGAPAWPASMPVPPGSVPLSESSAPSNRAERRTYPGSSASRLSSQRSSVRDSCAQAGSKTEPKVCSSPPIRRTARSRSEVPAAGTTEAVPGLAPTSPTASGRARRKAPAWAVRWRERMSPAVSVEAAWAVIGASVMAW